MGLTNTIRNTEVDFNFDFSRGLSSLSGSAVHELGTRGLMNVQNVLTSPASLTSPKSSPLMCQCSQSEKISVLKNNKEGFTLFPLLFMFLLTD